MTLRLQFALVAAIAAGAVHAHGGVRLGVGVGMALPYAPLPYSLIYPPADLHPHHGPAAAIPPPPSGFVPQVPANVYSTRPPGQPLYFYCAAAKGYYPYVRECSGGWEIVSAVPR